MLMGGSVFGLLWALKRIIFSFFRRCSEIYFRRYFAKVVLKAVKIVQSAKAYLCKITIFRDCVLISPSVPLLIREDKCAFPLHSL